MSKRRNAFVSYHHGQPGTDGNLEYRNKLRQIFEKNGDTLLWGAVPDKAIDPNLNDAEIRRQIREDYLRDTSVTIVLVGEKTWQRRQVDWEIGASLNDSDANPRSGLLGLLLPSHPEYPKYSKYTIPPRLHDNIECRYAVMYKWTEDPEAIAWMIDEAYKRKSKVQPNNSYPPFVNNRTGNRWCD